MDAPRIKTLFAPKIFSLSLTYVDQPKEIVIELESIMSGVLIQVPEHVQFYMEQKGVMTKTANQVNSSIVDIAII